MSKLRILNCKQFENSEIETFREVLSHENSEIIINRNDLNIANPELGEPEEGFFEIVCERLVMLKYHLVTIYIYHTLLGGMPVKFIGNYFVTFS